MHSMITAAVTMHHYVGSFWTSTSEILLINEMYQDHNAAPVLSVDDIFNDMPGLSDCQPLTVFKG